MTTLREFVEMLGGRPFKRYKFLDAEIFEIPPSKTQKRIVIVE